MKDEKYLAGSAFQILAYDEIRREGQKSSSIVVQDLNQRARSSQPTGGPKADADAVPYLDTVPNPLKQFGNNSKVNHLDSIGFLGAHNVGIFETFHIRDLMRSKIYFSGPRGRLFVLFCFMNVPYTVMPGSDSVGYICSSLAAY